jgi:release factor glutamine methyltransferase
VRDSAPLDADLLLMHVLGLSRVEIIVQQHRLLSDAETAAYENLVARRALREPVAYIVGAREFFGRIFAVTPDVLIPRPETEILVEQALSLAPPGAAVFEVGVGSGALICSILAERDDLRGAGNDICIRALCVARDNARSLGVSERLLLFAGRGCGGLRGGFQVIVANPPYIPEAHEALLDDDVMLYEPRSALFGGNDGLDIVQEIITGAPEALAAGGLLLMEAGMGQQGAVESLVKAKKGLAVKSWVKDLAGIPRVVIMERVHG